MSYPTPTFIDLLRYRWPYEVSQFMIIISDTGSGPFISAWNVPGVPQPTPMEIAAYETDPIFLANRAADFRKYYPDGYGDIQMQLGMIYSDLKNKTTTWTDHISEVECVTYPIGSPTSPPVIDNIVTEDLLSGLAATSALSDYVTADGLSTTLANYVLTSALASYVTSAALTSALSGYVTSTQLSTTLNRSIVMAASGSTQSISGTGKISLAFATEAVDSTNSFSSDTFTAPESGIYEINAFTRIANVAILSLIAAYEWQLYVTQAGSNNRSVMLDTYSHGILAALNSSLRGTVYLQLAANDTIKVQVQKTVSTALDCTNAYINIRRVRDL